MGLLVVVLLRERVRVEKIVVVATFVGSNGWVAMVADVLVPAVVEFAAALVDAAAAFVVSLVGAGGALVAVRAGADAAGVVVVVAAVVFAVVVAKIKERDVNLLTMFEKVYLEQSDKEGFWLK